jgi:indolepyruvate ferredoxin oxidoreductase alpha subunit
MAGVDVNDPGRVELYLGNEAISRGALEAGCGFVSAYPGTPSSEVVQTMAEVGKRNNVYVEWSANEKVAMEAAAGASFAGIRSMAVMKQNGVNVGLDFLCIMQMTGIDAGMVLLVADDPGPLSSNAEEDTRIVAKWLKFPLLEPANCQEAYEMTKWAFEISEQSGLVCMVRSLSRIGHTRSNVKVGELPKSTEKKAYFNDLCDMYAPARGKHLTSGGVGFLIFQPELFAKLDKIPAIVAAAPRQFDWYEGPEKPELVIITSGVSYTYTKEALGILKLLDRVGILKLGITWPLNNKLIKDNLRRAKRVLFIEESEPYLEDSIMEIASTLPVTQRKNLFYGKRNGYIKPYGDNNVDLIMEVLVRLTKAAPVLSRPAAFAEETQRLALEMPRRAWEFCPGCLYRPFYWALKTALRLDGRNGFATGDIGCYQLGGFNAGYYQTRTTHAMGAGTGVACGLGKLEQFGFNQPVLSVIGDSTFFHAGFAPLASGVWNRANFTLVVMDNSATAMTGHQPHPGTATTLMGDATQPLSIEAICRSLGCPVEVIDPFDIPATIDIILKLLKDNSGVKVLIVRRECELSRAKKTKAPFKMRVEKTKCIGEECGCSRTCTRMFHCPGLFWDAVVSKAVIDEAVCAGCGACAQICPQGAIIKEAV